ncbi:MAG: AAA family ATPase [Fimbriimonadales bacterium]
MSEADRYGHIFKSAEAYRADPEYSERRWVVEDFLPESYVAILAGATKSGKSCLATNLAVAVTLGEPFLEHRTVKAPVLWVACEESHEERSIALDAYPGLKPTLYITHRKLPIDLPDGIRVIRWWVRNTGAKLIVIDSLFSAVGAATLSDGHGARLALEGLKALCRDERCAALVLHHMIKDTSFGLVRERIAESTQILAAASMDLMMDVDRKGDGSREIWLRGHGRGDFANKVWLIASPDVARYDLVAHGDETVVGAQRSYEAMLKRLRGAETPVSAEDLAAAVNLNPKTVRNRLTELVRLGQVVAVGAAGKSNLYAVAESG